MAKYLIDVNSLMIPDLWNNEEFITKKNLFMKRTIENSSLLVFAILLVTLAACKKNDQINEPTVTHYDNINELLTGTYNGVCYTQRKNFGQQNYEIYDTLSSSITFKPQGEHCFQAEGCSTNTIAPLCIYLNEIDTLYKSSFHVGSRTWTIELNTRQKTIYTTVTTIHPTGFEKEEGYFKYN